VKLAEHDVLGIVGVRGAGKSHYAKNQVVKTPGRVVVWDPQGEYQTDNDLDEVSVAELMAEPTLLDEEDCRLAVVADWDKPEDLADEFAAFTALLKNARHEYVTKIVIDECALLRPYADGYLVAIATQSRHWRMPLVLIAQRATMIPPGARSQCSLFISFRQNDPADIDALEERIGKIKARQASRLPRRKFVIWSESEIFRGEKPKEKESEK
jgi:hypothetical protein